MYQLIRAVMKNPEDKTKIVLLTANISEEDVLLKEKFDALAKEHPKQFKAFYVLEKPPSGWSGESGRISKDLLQKAFPAPDGEKFKAFVCGPYVLLTTRALLLINQAWFLCRSLWDKEITKRPR